MRFSYRQALQASHRISLTVENGRSGSSALDRTPTSIVCKFWEMYLKNIWIRPLRTQTKLFFGRQDGNALRWCYQKTGYDTIDMVGSFQ